MKNFFILCLASILTLSFFPTKIIASQNTCAATISEETIDRILPALVCIGVENHPFYEAYGSDPGMYTYMQSFYDYMWPSMYWCGSGFVIDKDGYIVTNSHVVNTGTSFQVIFPSTGAVYTATLVGEDFQTDLAVLKINAEEDLPYLKFSDSNMLKKGDVVMSCGNSRKGFLPSSLSIGSVTGLNRNIISDGWYEIEGYIQTDAAINPGNSGSPLIDKNGEVIGVVVSLVPTCQGIGFAIPSRTAQSIAQKLIDHGQINRGFLGIMLDFEHPTMFDVFYFEPSVGAKVIHVIPGSSADGSLQEEDVIIEINGHKIRSPYDLRNRIGILEDGAQINLTIERNGNTQNLQITLEKEDPNYAYSSFIL